MLKSTLPCVELRGDLFRRLNSESLSSTTPRLIADILRHIFEELTILEKNILTLEKKILKLKKGA